MSLQDATINGGRVRREVEMRSIHIGDGAEMTLGHLRALVESSRDLSDDACVSGSEWSRQGVSLAALHIEQVTFQEVCDGCSGARLIFGDEGPEVCEMCGGTGEPASGISEVTA